MKKPICLILIICFMCLGLTACYDSKELDSWAYVYSIGIDKGISGKLRLTVQLPKVEMKKGSEGESGTPKKGDLIVITVDCPTINAGMNMINTSLSRTLNYTHTKFIVFSEDFAREGVGDTINGFRRLSQIRRIMHFFIVKGQAEEFINEFNPVLGASMPKIQEGLMIQEKETGLFLRSSFFEIENEIKSTKEQTSCALAGLNDFSNLLPQGSETTASWNVKGYSAGQLPRKGGNKFEFLGTALFDGDKMVGELDGEETKVLLMAKNELKETFITIPDPKVPGSYATMLVSLQKSPKIKVSFKNKIPIIHLKIFLEGDLINLHSDINYENESLKPVLENGFKEYIEDTLNSTIDKCKSLNSDVFDFGKKASVKFLTIQEWEEYGWNKQFKNAEVNTEVEVIIRRTGPVLKTTSDKSKEEK